jgi:hypothetical protein
MVGVKVEVLRRAYAALVLLLGCLACGSEGAHQNTGSLAMRLSTELNGVTYQLRTARFEVTGAESRTIDADESRMRIQFK